MPPRLPGQHAASVALRGPPHFLRDKALPDCGGIRPLLVPRFRSTAGPRDCPHNAARLRNVEFSVSQPSILGPYATLTAIACAPLTHRFLSITTTLSLWREREREGGGTAVHFRTIEVDFDVHRCIENERRGFDESPNDALRRLLKLGQPKATATTAVSSFVASRRAWSDQGVTLPHATPVRMRYNNHTYEGQIVDGSWVIGDRRFESPSGAASGVARTKKGKPTRLDGWIYWQVKLPGEESWKPLESLRPKVTLEQLGLATDVKRAT